MGTPYLSNARATGLGAEKSSDPQRLPLPQEPPTSDQKAFHKPLFGSPLTLPKGFLWAAGAITCFHLAYSSSFLSYLILGYLFCLVQLARLPTTRQAFYFGLATGLLVAGPQLYCFWVIFKTGAIALWFVVAFWTALFVALAQVCLKRFGLLRAAMAIPLVWTGLEYFRSELYYLRFSWLNTGYAFSGGPLSPLFHWIGMYGMGFAGMAAVAAVSALRPKSAMLLAFRVALLVIIALFFNAYFKLNQNKSMGQSLNIAGVQLEFPSDPEVLRSLDKLLMANPAADIFVLSEYTFDSPVPEKVKDWCRTHHRYLVVGGKDPAPESNFYDTAFVVGPTGEIVFRQVKSVPIQFFKDGLPATEQRLWESPWGKIGLCVCYDLSYTRVIDRLVRQGAQALIVPTMDVVDWGRNQHELHARVAPVRAAELGIPIFRLASSGISQYVDANGRVVTQAGFPGEGEILGGTLTLANPGSLPLDRWLGPFCTAAIAVLVSFFCFRWFVENRRKTT